MRVLFMPRYWIRVYILSWHILLQIIIFGRKAPSFILHVPMHAGDGDYVLETFEFAHDECAVSPRAGV